MVREVLLFDRVPSTNQIALQMGGTGMPGGVLILAEAQDQGRGRLNRTWVSPSGVNLYLSLLLRPFQEVREFPLFSLATAVAVVRAIRIATGLPVVAKWPNDILCDDKKVAGILLETCKKSGEVPYLVMGIGINVNWDTNDIPEDLRPQASSLKIALGRIVDRNRLVNEILIALADQVKLLHDYKSDLIISGLSEVCDTLGKLVQVATPDKTYQGVAESISQDGGLILRLADKSQRIIYVGDVTKVTKLPPLKRIHWGAT
jgi:BirA family biotin operon repressor/biotin-[acetyl-CoA-carboxylase] ligase